MVKVLVVDDSPVVREFLVHILSLDSEIRVVGTANNGAEALEAVKRYEPDVITMDISMPRMNGFEATRRIMETHPSPIVIVSGSSHPKEVATTFRAIEAGALAVVQKPRGIAHPDHEPTAAELVRTVKLMAEVKVVRRWARPRREASTPAALPPAEVELKPVPAEIKVVAVGASTGGPVVLQTILSRIPKDFPAPVLVVQHIAPGFVQGFVEWLSQTSGLPIHVATHGKGLLPGQVYVAPDGFQMEVEVGGRISLTQAGPENGVRPSVSHLFRSIANVYGRNAIGVLLTGMGKDGAEELRWMKEKGAITIAQDKASSVVHGMPGEAIKLDAAMYVLSTDQIAAALENLVIQRRLGKRG